MTTWPLTLYFDGNCRICQQEMHWLAARDRAGRLCYVDIAREGAELPADAPGIPAMMARIHARDATGRWLVGVAVIRATRQAIGRGWTVAWTGWPLLRPLMDALYRGFARNRYRFSPLWFGRGCPDGRCGLPTRNEEA